MRIGILYDREDEYPGVVRTSSHDTFAEFEPESTIAVMEAAIRHCGHEPVRLCGPLSILKNRPDVDLVWNISEGYGTRNREAWGPALLEMYDIPFLGSDALTLSVSLDKRLTKIVANTIGLSVVGFPFSVDQERGVDSSNRVDAIDPYRKPATENRKHFVKPRYEGTAKGLTAANIVETDAELDAAVDRIREEYGQDAVVEPFLAGAEFTVAVLGQPLKAYPVLERGLDAATKLGSHVMKDGGEVLVSGSLTPELEARLQDWSLRLCAELGVKHFARLDFKCDEAGNPFFLEINPLPTFAVDQTFAILAELEGVEYAEWLGERLREIIPIL
jgi:D-alanine-D-alanine ligase